LAKITSACVTRGRIRPRCRAVDRVYLPNLIEDFKSRRCWQSGHVDRELLTERHGNARKRAKRQSCNQDETGPF
jgi:hypothetical protein